MKIDDDDFEYESNEPIPGQMCYDELLTPIEELNEEEKPDTTVADGQLDMWNLKNDEKNELKLQNSSINEVDKKEENIKKNNDGNSNFEKEKTDFVTKNENLEKIKNEEKSIKTGIF